MSTHEKVESLVETVINGNNINTYAVYKNRLNSIKRDDIVLYGDGVGVSVTATSKIDCIKQIAANF